MQNSSMLALSLPPAIQIPASGSVTYPITIYLRRREGAWAMPPRPRRSASSIRWATVMPPG